MKPSYSVNYYYHYSGPEIAEIETTTKADVEKGEKA